MSRVFLFRKYIAGASQISRRLFMTSRVTRSEDRIVPKKEASVIDKPAEDADLLKTDDERNLIVVNVPMKVDMISGVPEEHIKERLVRISKASKSAMQSGTDNTHSWIMQFETRQRWENPLMGWCSTGDPLSNLQLRFRTKEDAVAFCDKNSWQWYVEKEKPIKPRVKSYAFNFSWDKRTRVSTK